ncbi:MAG: MG2 domain-containing protein [Pirellulales bacterium]
MARYRIAESYFNFNRTEDAIESLQGLLEDNQFKESPEVPTARYLLGAAFLRQKNFDKAITTWREYLTKHPTHGRWSEAQQAIINAEYTKGLVAYQKKDYDEASLIWQEFLVKYPVDARNRSIQLLFGNMFYAEEKWEEAIESWRRVVSKFPNTNESSQALYRVGLTIEQKQLKLNEAIEEYKKLTWGSHAATAKQRIHLLSSKKLEIHTTRIFRSDEIPKIALKTRNLECVTVKVYSVDLETYFRKMHLASGVEGLDIALIDPDSSFEYGIENFEKYREFSNEVEVSLPAGMDGKERTSGVMAVTVSSATQETTTLVVQSDLDIIVKSSRDEVFVFAENMKTGKAWPNVKLLISNGSEVFGEVKTDKNGVYHAERKELRDPADVRVFGISDGSIASNVVSLKGLGVSRGLEQKGYLYTDRSTYQPGQLVNLRGIIRTVDGDVYQVPENKEYELEVFDPRTRLVFDKKVTLNNFGTFHSHFILPGEVPQGEYRVVLRQKDKQQYEGSFQVRSYQLPPAYVTIESERSIYYRGEKIKGTITANYYHGAPMANTEVRYQLANGRNITAKTDNKGQVEFEFETRDFRYTQPLNLQVSLPVHNIQQVKTILLSTQGFTIATKTPRDVYLAGETFEVEATIVDMDGKLVAAETVMKLYQLLDSADADGNQEKLISEETVETDKETGKVLNTLVVKEGGRYMVRFEAIDRFENAISGQSNFSISDEDDSIRLRILAEQLTYKVGETANVKVHWREKPALALITFQGAKILDYRLVKLKKGANDIEVPVQSKLAPNFQMSIAVMTDLRDIDPEKPRKRFHEAVSPFQVERDLKIQLTLPEGKHQPGDKIKVKLTTTDALGNPVAAEVSLAMVEKALMDRFPERIASIRHFFQGNVRQLAVRTTSSIEFSYKPATQAINELLLAEVERLEVEGLEEKRLAMLGAQVHPVGDFPAVPMPVGLDLNIDAVNGPGNNANAGGYGYRMGRGNASQQLPGVRYSINDLQAQSGAGYGVGGGGTIQGWASSNRAQQRGQIATIKLNDGAIMRWDESSIQVAGKLSVQDRRAKDFGTENNFAIQNNYNTSWGKQNGTANHWYFDNNDRKEIQVLSKSGQFRNLNFSTELGDQWDIMLNTVADQGNMILAGIQLHETGFWDPAIETNDKGVAEVEFTLPDRSTAWKFIAKGITVDTTAGSTTEELIVSKELFGEIKLASAFVDGDRIQIPVTVHNQLVEKGEIEVTLTFAIGDKKQTETKRVKFTAKGMKDVVFPVEFKIPTKGRKVAKPESAIIFQLLVASGKTKDSSFRSVPLLPAGLPVYAVESGTSSSDTSAFLARPENMPWSSPQLQVVVGPSIQRSLLDVVFGSPVWCQVDSQRYASGIDTATSNLISSIALQKLLGGSRDVENPHADAIDQSIRNHIRLLVSMQKEDGSWSWTGSTKNGNRYGSARALWALALAKNAGYKVGDDLLQRATTYLKNQVTQSTVGDYETKATLLHALTEAGQEDFSLANQLYRNRNSLSATGLAYLALSFDRMKRTDTAMELTKLVSQKLKSGDAKAGLSWNSSDIETHALYALCLYRTQPTSKEFEAETKWLMKKRVGHRWAPEKATGPAMLAVCGWNTGKQFKAEKYALTVLVNDKKVKTLEFDVDSTTQTVNVPSELLSGTKKDTVRFELTGRGQFSYQCVMGGFVASDKLKNTSNKWTIRRYYTPAQLEFDGKPVPRGFNVVTGSYSSFRNTLTQLPIAKRGHVELSLYRNNNQNSLKDQQMEYLVVTEPIPSGVSIDERSIRGQFDRYEITPGAITFYIGGNRSIGSIYYDMIGSLAGDFQPGPTVVRDAYHLDQMVVAKPYKLSVLAYGKKSGDQYRLTPRELYELGKLNFEKQDYAVAKTHLTELFNNWNLRTEYFKPSISMLMDIHLAQNDAAGSVKYFELVIDKYPELEILFAKLMQVAHSYHQIGEYERAHLVYRATVEANFMLESQVAGFLQGQAEFLRSVDVMTALLRNSPPESYVATADYALAQQIFAKAPEAINDPKLKEKNIDCITLVRRSLAMLEGFLTANPEDPSAEQAAFSLATGLLELDGFESAITACSKYTTRYSKSDFLSSYWYITGFCHFALGQHKQALALCEKVATYKRPTNLSGNHEQAEQNKWRTIYIMGQVYHSLGDAADAIKQYTQVKDRFADAAQAIEFFVRKDIALDEISTFGLKDQKEKVEIELKYRNVAKCDLNVYRIDLMKFSLLRRNLNAITSINLAGIRPYHEAVVDLEDGLDYGDRTKKIELPLKEEGAYLVVCRGDNLHASGLVLVTPLEVKVQENATSGRVRVTIRDTAADKYVPEVHVKVIGSANQDFNSGETDLRGVFVADGIQGQATVIAQTEGGRYAFFRGEQSLAIPAPNAPSSEAQPQVNAPSGSNQKKQRDELLRGIQGGNRAIQIEQEQNLDRFYNNGIQKGIKNFKF